MHIIFTCSLSALIYDFDHFILKSYLSQSSFTMLLVFTSTISWLFICVVYDYEFLILLSKRCLSYLYYTFAYLYSDPGIGCGGIQERA